MRVLCVMAAALMSAPIAFALGDEPADWDMYDESPAVPLADISGDAPPPMLLGRLDPEGHTILYGPGGVGKGALACWWIVQLVHTGHRVLILDYEGHPEEWRRRIGSLDPSALGGVWYLRPSQPLRDAAGHIRSEADRLGITYVVIDSAVMACGDDPMKPETARRYGAALLLIGRPALTLAHVTKIDDGRYPFGSVFWANLARTMWSLMPDGDAALLTHRKHNSYARLPSQTVAMTWTDGLLREVWERSHAASMGDELAALLADTAGMTVAQIVTELTGADRVVSRQTVNAALRRGVGPNGRFTCIQGESGMVWRVCA